MRGKRAISLKRGMTVTPESQAKIDTAIDEWLYFQKLPEEWHGFSLKRNRALQDEIYDLFGYSHPVFHRHVLVYYHDETQEYKLRERVGTLEFCNIECIARDLDSFERLLQDNLEKILLGMIHFQPETVSSMLTEKKITTWNYESILPPTIEGFERFIQPKQPLRITNGSYVIIDYENFNKNSNMAIYYNIYRDDFFCEAHVNGTEKIFYQFDSHLLEDLEEKIQHNLISCLHEIANSADFQRHD